MTMWGRKLLQALEPSSGRVFPMLCWGENGRQYAQRAKGALNLLPLSMPRRKRQPTRRLCLPSVTPPPKTTKPVS